MNRTVEHRVFMISVACILLASVNEARRLSASDTLFGRWKPFDWNVSHTYDPQEGYAVRPAAEVIETVTVRWEPPVLDRLGNLCTLRGRLYFVPAGSDEPTPVDWFQGVSLYLSRYPDAEPNWTNGMGYQNTLYDTAKVSPSGEFELSFDVRDTLDDRSLSEHFQCGLALASHTMTRRGKEHVAWNGQIPVISSSVHMLEIPAAPELPQALEMLNQAAGWPFENPNGVHLIRAVNALQPLGKEDALATLDEFLELQAASANRHRDRHLTFWIIRALFEPIDIDERMPYPGIAVSFLPYEERDASAWPINPMGLVGDVPFMLGEQAALGGREEAPEEHLEWVRRHGMIRDEPLHPTMNPLAAAEIILADATYLKSVDENEWKDRRTRELRLQAMAMIEGLLPPITADFYHQTDFELQWRERVEQSIELGITWDADQQEFVIPTEE